LLIAVLVAVVAAAATLATGLRRRALASGAALRFGPSHPQAWPSLNLELRSAADGYLGDRLRHAATLFGFTPADFSPRWPLPDGIRDCVAWARPLVRRV
jgi:hypothetical protein